jgi:predicted transcriptional regulator/SAM-dependent methyltransferase
MSLADLCASAWALAALRVAIDADLLPAMARGERDAGALAAETHIDPTITLRILEILEANGFVSGTGSGGRRTFTLTAEGKDLAGRTDWIRADLAVTLGSTSAFVVEGRRSDLGGGWQHADGEVIRSQSRLSELLNATMLTTLLTAVPELDRLARDGAQFLDVGAGAAGISIALCRRFTSLYAVALEPLRAARLEAKTKIDANGLANRIELRGERLDQLTDERRYDVVFVPAPFMRDAALTEGLVRVKNALRPGGVAMLFTFRPPPDARCAAASRLRLQLWGGGARSQDDLAGLVESAGLDATKLVVPGAALPVIARAKAGV